MPRLKTSPDKIEGMPPMPEQLVTVRLDGFKPKYSKDRQSVNLNPTMVIINNADYNDRRVFENLNSKGEWVWPEFCHALGVDLERDGDGNYVFPGDFDGPEDEPTKWEYKGPLLGQTGQLYLVQADNGKGGITNKVKNYLCRVPGCTHKHKDNLVS